MERGASKNFPYTIQATVKLNNFLEKADHCN